MPSRLLSACAVAAAVLCWPHVAASADGALLPPTPLVLKDGRIAQVTVHTVRFPLGKDQPDEAEQAALTGLVDELATDCFLTAQAVGHVEPGPGSDGETLAAHRLARARADRVQAALTGRGLPASSIASVWDWQFAIREPRVTLWVFRLAEGDDCDNQPIAQAGAAPAGAEAPVPAVVEQPAPPAAEPQPEMVVDASAAAEAAVPAPLQAPEAAEPEPVAAAVGADAGAGAAGKAAAVAEQETAPAAPTAETATAAEEAPEQATEVEQAAQAEQPTQVEQAPQVGQAPQVEPALPIELAAQPEPPAQAGAESDAATLAITFDVNSSYFPKGISRELKALVGGLEPQRTYEAVLEGAVSAEALRNGGDKESRTYNRWIADRRMDRVADWLRQNVGRSLSITHGYVENDSSRRVTVRLRPVP